MMVTHEFEIRALCPVDGSEDVYAATLTINTMMSVETILEVIAPYSTREAYQESLTAILADRLGGTLTTVGCHSGVRTTVTVEG